MKQRSNSRRRRYTAEERAKYVELFRESGLTQQDFAQQHGFHAVTWRQWLRRSKEKTAACTNGQPVFKEFSVPAPAVGWSAEIALGHEVTVRLGASATTELLVQLVNRLGRVC